MASLVRVHEKARHHFPPGPLKGRAGSEAHSARRQPLWKAWCVEGMPALSGPPPGGGLLPASTRNALGAQQRAKWRADVAQSIQGLVTPIPEVPAGVRFLPLRCLSLFYHHAQGGSWERSRAQRSGPSNLMYNSCHRSN